MDSKKITKCIPTLIFCAFIGFMMAMFFIVPKEEYSANEKRVLKELPSITLESIFNGDFGEDFEVYLSDHFEWRTFFVGMNAYYDLISGRNGASGVYKAKDGYIINKPVLEDKDNLIKNISKISRFVDNAGYKADIMIVPSTGYIMEEKLPKIHLDYNDSSIINMAVSKLSNNINFIGLTSAFKDAKDNSQIYYKTDHHWTTQGAYVAYMQYCLNKGIEPLAKSSFKVNRYDNFFGTTYSRGAWWLSKPDTLEVWEDKRGYDVNVEIDDGAEGKKQSNSMFFMEHLKNDDKYPVFLDGNHSFVKITNKNVKSGKLLMLKDSFGHSIAPFLMNHYREVYMVDLRYYKSTVSSLIDKEKIDDIFIIYGLENIVNDKNIVWLK